MIIGVTGGIASGKTAVSKYLEAKGYPVIDADVIAREIMTPNSNALASIRKQFGEAYINEDGTLNRGQLASLIFHDESARERLNAITYPAIKKRAEDQIKSLQVEPIIVLVVPMLYESGMDRLCDDVWLIQTDESVRRIRLSERDGIDLAYAQCKIEAQVKNQIGAATSTMKVLNNNGDLEGLYQQIESFLKKY